MGDVVNLNRFRKRKRAQEQRGAADANARRFGRTSAQHEREDAMRRRLDEHLAGVMRDAKQEDRSADD